MKQHSRCYHLCLSDHAKPYPFDGTEKRCMDDIHNNPVVAAIGTNPTYY
ncbi:MAG TPA: hypothetical protein VK766_04625 [Cytophagaceae bacterium]|nr:hypothetical protein [Cytophagaceae bacterium]